MLSCLFYKIKLCYKIGMKSYKIGVKIFLFFFIFLNICCSLSYAGEAMVWLEKDKKIDVWPECVTLVRNIPGTDIYRVKFKSASDCLNKIRQLKKVVFVEETKSLVIPDFVGVAGNRGDGKTCIAGLKNSDLLEKLGTGKNIVVAVIDTGISLSLYGSFVKKNSGEIPGDGIDNDSNGYIDDYYGWDFGDMDSDPSDMLGHGTEVASIILSTAPDVKIIPIKVDSGMDMSFSTGDATEAIYYAIARGADIINLSFSADDFSYAIYSAIIAAVNSGCIVVAAAGNDGSDVNFPASMSQVISVGSYDAFGLPSWFSSYGKNLDILGPGENVCAKGIDGSTTMVSGTSFSTPVISGAAAVLLSMNPHLKLESVKKILFKGVKDILDPGWDMASGYGDINADALVTAATPHINLPDKILRGNQLNLDLTLPPTESLAYVLLALKFENIPWWLDSTGLWNRADKQDYAPFMTIQSDDFITIYLYGQNSIYDAIDTSLLPLGNYLWAIAIFDKNGNKLAPIGLKELYLYQ